MNLLSSLVLAIATRRTLLFDWDPVPARKWFDSQKEVIGHAGYKQTFGDPPFAFSYREALEATGWTDSDARKGSAEIDWRHRDFLVGLRTRDMDAVYPHSVLFIQRFDWWAPLLLANQRYSELLFRGTTDEEIFSVLFKYLFPLKDEDAAIARPDCPWFVQVRRNWERKTAPLAAFVSCARLHSLDGPGGRLLSDTSEDPGDTGLSLVREGYCRTGESSCDRQTLYTMYALSKCNQGAVLTATSTFGVCIAGLGRIPLVLRVDDQGRCEALSRSDPALDVGVLASQEKELVQVMQLVDRSAYTAAFVYLAYRISDGGVDELRRSIDILHKHFNQYHHYPLVLLVDDSRQWGWLQNDFSERVHLVHVDPADWEIPSGASDCPPVFRLRSNPDHKGFPLSYRQMSRYAAGYLLNHPYLAQFDYVLKIDADTHTTDAWQKDPFEEMHKKHAKFAFWISYSDTPDVTDQLFETFQQYLEEFSLTPKQPRLIVDSQGRYRRTNFYGCFLAAQTEFFRRPEYLHLFQYFDRRHGWFKYRWDEQKIYAFYVALYLDESEVEFMDYVRIEHQQWATKAQRI